MPKYIGGDIIELVCKHPDLGEHRFQVKANETFNVNTGGLRSEDDNALVSGAGTMVDKMNRVRPSMEGPILVDFDSMTEQDALDALSASSKLGTWILTHVSGVSWKMQGKPVGELVADTNAGTMPLKVSGSGKMQKL